MVNALRLTSGDNVANVLTDVCRGDDIGFGGQPAPLAAADDVPKHHKIALRDLPEGAEVIRGGVTIGVITRDTRAGAHVHTHNLTSLRARSAQGTTS